MRLLHFILGALATTVLVAVVGDIASAKTPAADNEPGRLVQAALDSEREGPSTARATLLEQALARDPSFAPARWQSGFVRWQDEWLSPEDVAARTADDKTLAAYRKLRSESVDSADSHRTLARWCHKNKLADEARAHWLKVFEFEPDDNEARGALGLHEFEGRLQTNEQIAQAKKHNAEQQRANQKYKPAVTRWRAAFEHGTTSQRAEATTELEKLTDPAAMIALVSCFKPGGDAKKKEPLQLLVIAAVGRMLNQDATDLLLQLALEPDSVAIRKAATDELKKRPTFTYVPQLIAAVPANLKTRFHVMTYGDGQLVRRSEILLEGRDFEYSISHDVIDRPSLLGAGPGIFTGAADQLQNVATTDVPGAAASNPAARQYELWRQALTARIRYVLEETTGFLNTSDPRLWERQWNDYNGWYNSPFSMRPYRTYAQNTYDYTPSYGTPVIARDYSPRNYPHAQRPTPTPTPAPTHAAASHGAATIPSFHLRITLPNMSHHSCFCAGTPVLTLTGLRPIEDIRAGDRILAQDLRTGELNYRAVQETTLRSPMPLLKLSLGSETIRVTQGHPIWVVGAGWRMAKFLNVGDRVHGMLGASVIDGIEEERPAEVYNLVVSNWHNYFVGQQHILVHDNSPLELVGVPVPGSLATAVAADGTTAAAKGND